MNVILQSAPGVGRTYLAKRIAYSMMDVKDVESVKIVQFQQTYSYENFIMGFRPSSSGFELKKGVFYTFCKRSEEDSDNDYFFFIIFDLKPEFSSEGFSAYREGLGSQKFDALIRCVEELNSQISDDDTLGKGFCIGHSYFCNMSPDELNDDKLSCIVEYELIPLLKEYWFDEPIKVKYWISNLRSAIK